MLKYNLFWNIVNIVVLLLELSMLFLVLDEFANRRKENKRICIHIVIIFTITQSMRICDVYPEFNSLISLGLCMLFYKNNYDVNWSKAIIIPSVFIMLGTAFDFLGLSIVKIFNNIDNIQLILDYNEYRFQGIIISKSLLVVCIVLLKYCKVSNNIKKRDFILIGIPIMVNIISVLYIFKYEMILNEEYNISSNQPIFISLFLCASSLALVVVVLEIAKHNKLQIENTLMKEKINMEYEYYMKLEEQQKKISRIHHDMKNHMICINSLSDNEDIKKYIEGINLELSQLDYNFNTKNKIVDIIINEKKSICEKSKIDFNVVADLSKINFMKMNDICTIFANAIDNAIQACEKIDNEEIKRYIKVNATYINGFCIIKFENSKINEIIEENKVIITDKKDSLYHGIGIKNIRKAISNYNGEVDINYTHNIFTLTLMIPLKLPK